MATIDGVILCFTPIDPVKELFQAAVLDGVIAVPIRDNSHGKHRHRHACHALTGDRTVR